MFSHGKALLWLVELLVSNQLGGQQKRHKVGVTGWELVLYGKGTNLLSYG